MNFNILLLILRLGTVDTQHIALCTKIPGKTRERNMTREEYAVGRRGWPSGSIACRHNSRQGRKNITNKRDKYISIWGNEITLTNTSKSKLELKSHTFQANREKGMKTETCI